LPGALRVRRKHAASVSPFAHSRATRARFAMGCRSDRLSAKASACSGSVAPAQRPTLAFALAIDAA